MTGSYELYMNDVLIDNDGLLFNTFWRPKNLTFNLGILSQGSYNLTLVVYDEAGHQNSDSCRIIVGSYFLNREGRTVIEYGDTESIQWSGNAIEPFIVNITINETVINSFIWDGFNFSLDLSSLEIGEHNISLLLFNNTELLYTDSFTVIVVDSVSSIITITPMDLTLTWNETKTLHWEAYDNFPSYWQIYINDVPQESQDWVEENLTVNWDVPILNEGVYNITLAVYDRLDRVTSSSIWLVIISPSPPIIAATPQQTFFNWDQKDITLSWEVHGGISWILWKNDQKAFTGLIQGNDVSINIENWQTYQWTPGIYNLTLEVIDKFGLSTAVSIWIDISLGDPYANSIVYERSNWFLEENNAIGAPDGEYATIFPDYGNGYLTLDMGRNEEIIDGTGNDFTIITEGGEYLVSVGNDKTQPLTLMGEGTGNTSFDLHTVGFDTARYIQVKYSIGAVVKLDSIEALNYNSLNSDNDPPTIDGPGDQSVWLNQSSITLQWNVDDVTMWNYSILVDTQTVESGPWMDTIITYTYPIIAIGQIHITLILYDLFGSYAEDTVIIDILAIPTTTSTSKKNAPINGFQPLLGLVTLGLIIARFRRKKKQNS
jgi:hypothetical protein